MDRELREGDALDGGFVVLETPGHSPGHLSYWREDDRTLIAGDVLFGRHPITGRPGLHEPPARFTPDVARNREQIRRARGAAPAADGLRPRQAVARPGRAGALRRRPAGVAGRHRLASRGVEPVLSPPELASAPAPPLHLRGDPPPRSGGLITLLRFARRNGMLNRKYARLMVRLAYYKLKLRGRLQLDGPAFIGPDVTLEIGPGATLRLGRWSWIGHGCKIRVHEGECEIGAKTVMGQECTISAFQHVSIGRECILADRVMLIDFDHGVVEVERPIRDAGHLQARRPRRAQRLGRLRRAASSAARRSATTAWWGRTRW